MATIPAIIMVSVETIRREELNFSNLYKNGLNRYKRNTPAVTRVEEWTKAETGVGAAIAAGNQAEKGICADFVIDATKIVNQIHGWNEDELINMILQSSIDKVQAIEIKSITSPTRFDKAVMRPAAEDLWFW